MKCTALLLIALFVGTTHAFSTNNRIPTQQIIQHSSTTSLYGKGRRGKLANNVSLDDDGNVKLISNKQKQKLGSSRGRRSNKKNSGGEISPLLAEWAKEDGDDSTSTSSSAASSFDNTAALSKSDIFTSFNDDSSNSKKKKGKKKSNQGGALLTQTQTTQMDELLTQLTDMISTTNCNVQDIVSKITSLVTLGNTFGNNDSILLPTLKSILSTKPKGDETSPSYRLAWVGSDSAICHIGTSLHKVPLARLQEMYIILGYNKWELLEVIRILGPFPNVRNTLKGELKVKKLNSNGIAANTNGKEREGVRMEISYTSMVDGTGKEILAGKEDNVKRVELDVWFANEKALVCTVPSDEDGNGDPLSGGDGSNLLLFLKEDDLDESLEKLRAA